jgi:hypothetical protein
MGMNAAQAAAQYVYVELAEGRITNRAIIRRVDEVDGWGRPERYATCFRATDYLKAWRNNHRNANGNPTTKGFDGPLWSDGYYTDHDGKNDAGEPDAGAALDETRAVVRKLEALGVARGAIDVWFTGGRGFHLRVPHTIFGGFEPDRRLPKRLKALDRLLNGKATEADARDDSVYSTLRLFRVEGSQHEGTGLYKVRLTVDELLSLGIDEIRALARQPRRPEDIPGYFPVDDDEWMPVDALVDLWQQAAEQVRDSEPTTRPPAAAKDARNRQTIAAIAAAWEHGQDNHNYILCIAGFLTGLTSAEHAEELLKAAAGQAADPTFQKADWKAEIERACQDSAAKRNSGEPIRGLPTLGQRYPALAAVLGALWPSSRLTTAADESSFGTFDTDPLQTAPGEWPTPDPIEQALPAPRLPLELFPIELAGATEDAAERIRCPVDYIAWSALVSLAGLIGRNAGIRPRLHDDWTERPVLWLVSIGPPSWLKSPGIDYGTRPLRRQQQRDREAYARALADWKDEVAQIREDNPKAKPSDLPPEPKMRRSITTDSTVEKLSDLLEPEVSRGLTVFRDELAGLVYDLNKYRNGSDRQFYLQAYSGGLYVVDRVMRGSKYIEDLLLNIVGGIQPEVARDIFTTGPDDGLGARFTAIWPSGPPAWETVDRLPSKAARDALDAVCDRLADADWQELLLIDDFKPQPYCQFSEEARDLFARWESELMGGLQAGEYTDRHEGRAGKYRGLAARLALVFHLTSWAAGRVVDPRYVPASTIRQVLDVMDTYVLPMERRVFSEYAVTPAATGGRRIARWLKGERRESFRVREIRRHHWAGLTEEQDVLAALDWLTTARWVREAARDKHRLGRPPVSFIVNPLIYVK